MKNIDYKIDLKVPVIAETQLMVAGAGPAGLGAAVTAARQGLEVVLAESSGAPGGAAVQAEVTPFMPSHLQKPDGEHALDRPVYIEYGRRMRTYLPEEMLNARPDGEMCNDAARTVSREAAILAAEDMLLDAGVSLLYHHTLFDVVVRDGVVEYVILQSKSGLVAVKAASFIDATGDADLAAKAGCEFEYGDDDGLCQPMTLCFKLSGINRAAIPADFQLRYRAAKASGELDCPRENLLYFDTFEPDTLHFNTTRVVGKSAINGQELSEAEIEGRRQLRNVFFYLRKSMPGFEHARLRSIAPQIGIRESRRIVGRARLTAGDFKQRSKFPDAVARCNYPVDIHSSTGAGTEMIPMGHDDFYEIPYGCLIPGKVKNLLVAGRSISGDRRINSSFRVMPTAMSLGQA
ncbi:MAG: FAD-dependent oxidoreductase, partial [Victivallaceae bacterium]|nr:FAD-dependent oxidoreductase [Victivallaceae bacterium]